MSTSGPSPSPLSPPLSPSLSPSDPDTPDRARRLGVRVAVIGLTGTAALFGIVGTASAHVTAEPGTVEQGSYTKVAFRTPNEEDDAVTTQLEVTFPTDHPIASVSIQPVPGWKVTEEKTPLATPLTTDDGQVTEAVSKITWTGGRIEPGQFQEFDVSLGPIPTGADQLEFKAVQTYDDGTVVRWIDDTPPGGPEPEHPAPTLKLIAAQDDADAPAPAAPAASPAPPAAEAAAPPAGNGGLGFGIVGAVLGLIGAVTGGLALRRRSGSSHS